MSEIHDAFAPLGQAPINLPSSSAMHPEQGEIIRQSKEILVNLPTARPLLDFANLNQVSISVLNGKEPEFSSPDNKSVVLIAPRIYAKDIKELALCLACGLKIVQNYYLGFRPTTASHDTLEWKNEQAGKLLDIIILMCKIAEEYVVVSNDTKFVDLIKRLGHSDMYEAFLNKAPYEELEKIMLKSINK